MPKSFSHRADDMRIPNTTISGTEFEHETIMSVWEKARRQPGFETFSLDARGATISRFEYGRRSSYGWVIDRIVPLHEGGTDDIDNLRPLHWKNAPASLIPPSEHPLRS